METKRKSLSENRSPICKFSSEFFFFFSFVHRGQSTFILFDKQLPTPSQEFGRTEPVFQPTGCVRQDPAEAIGQVDGLAIKVYWNSGRFAGFGRDQIETTAKNPTDFGRTWDWIHFMVRHDRQFEQLRSGRADVSHDEDIDRPQTNCRTQFRFGRSSPAAIPSHRNADVRPGKHPTVCAQKFVENFEPPSFLDWQQKSAEKQDPETCTAATQVRHIAALLFPARHQRRFHRPRQILFSSSSRTQSIVSSSFTFL